MGEILRSFDASAPDLAVVARSYAEVFSGFPWYEVSRCDSCGTFGSSLPEASSSCLKCGTGVLKLEAYPLDETVDYIKDELSHPTPHGILGATIDFGEKGMRVEGFGWGYGLSKLKLVEAKYHSGEMQEMVGRLLTEHPAFFYVSEVGVLPNLQQKGLGTNLTTSLVEYATQYHRAIVLRTNEDSGMRKIAERLGMKPLYGLTTGLKDSENEARVLFLGVV